MSKRTTSAVVLGCVAALAFIVPLAAQTAVAASHPTVLKAAHLFDAVSGRLTDRAAIVVANGKIQSVGNTVTPADAEVIAIPFPQSVRIARPEEQAANSSHCHLRLPRYVMGRLARSAWANVPSSR